MSSVVREYGNRGQDGVTNGINSSVDDNVTSSRPGSDVPGTWSTEAAKSFAQMPTTPEAIIAQVRRQLADDASRVMTVEPAVLDQAAERAVRELWGSRIKTFVPVLALRQAREILRDLESVLSVPCPERRTEAPMALPPFQERRMNGVFAIHDATTRDVRDVL